MTGLYIHIPICASKCCYCDFVSMPMGRQMRSRYIDALEQEIAARTANTEIGTIYIGGGNPLSLECDELERVLIASRVTDNVREFSIEANPESMTDAKAAILTKHGISRVSLGLQTHDDTILTHIGRRHNYSDFVSAVYAIQRVGIHNISCDIMLGLPNQSLESVVASVNYAIDLGVKHISAYGLKVEEGTPLYKTRYEPCSELQADMYAAVSDILTASGYARYEISNFAQRGFECKHNMLYWELEPYIGCGLAAHSLVRTRRSNTTNLTKYIAGDIIDTEEKEPPDATEYIMLKLRLSTGLDLTELNDKYGLDLAKTKKSAINRLICSGMIMLQDNTIRITSDKQYISNSIILQLID